MDCKNGRENKNTKTMKKKKKTKKKERKRWQNEMAFILYARAINSSHLSGHFCADNDVSHPRISSHISGREKKTFSGTCSQFPVFFAREICLFLLFSYASARSAGLSRANSLTKAPMRRHNSAASTPATRGHRTGSAPANKPCAPATGSPRERKKKRKNEGRGNPNEKEARGEHRE